jgi:hypothetical protein
MVLARTCKLCGQGFEVERASHRPREYCFECQPVGYKIVKVPGQDRVKLRRWPPLFPRMSVWTRFR